MISSAGEYTLTSIEIYNFHCSYRGYRLDGCYSSKFLRSSARRFLLEILARGKRYDQ